MAAQEQNTEATAEKKPTAKKTAAKKTTTPRAASSRAKAAQAAPEVTQEMIAERAYVISQSDDASSDVENWLRAEAELQTA